jgi:hypothetical protein
VLYADASCERKGRSNGASAPTSRVAGWTTSVEPGAVMLAVLFSALAGVGFGYDPPRKAAFLGIDPIA